MPITRRRVTSAADMKALAHPVRLDVLELLIVNGPMTASDAAFQLAQTPANVSWHLRKLAEHGFVREARGATGRQRPWQAVSEGLEWGRDDPDARPDESTELAAEALTDMLVERELQRLRAARASRDREPVAWREATGLIHSQLWLTAEEAREVRERLQELLLTHAERSGAPGNRPAEARLVSLVGWLVPSGPRRVPEPS
jgi:DNA-binding transcriptional ArsR family regulator